MLGVRPSFPEFDITSLVPIPRKCFAVDYVLRNQNMPSVLGIVSLAREAQTEKVNAQIPCHSIISNGVG